MRVALTGASGFIGSFTARRLAAAGHVVTALVRASSRREHIADVVDSFVEGDQADAAVWPRLLDGAEAVVHNAVDWDAVGSPREHHDKNVRAALDLLSESSPRRFVFVSSIAVHHDMRPRWQGRPDEDHPLRPNTAYGAAKAAVEAFLWSEHFGQAQGKAGRHTAAVRPCGVYGIDPKLERSHGYRLLQKAADGERLSKPGGGKFVHVEDVAAAIVAALVRDDAAGQPFNLVDCYARWSDWAEMAGEVLGKRVEIEESSAAGPQNVFSKERAKSLGIGGDFLERGHEGIRRHLEELAEVMRRAGQL